MKQFYLLAALLFIPFITFAQYGDGDYVSVADGNWATATTWNVYDLPTNSFSPAPGQPIPMSNVWVLHNVEVTSS